MNKDAERYLAQVPADRKVLVEQLHALILHLYPRMNINMLGTDAAGAQFTNTREQAKFFT